MKKKQQDYASDNFLSHDVSEIHATRVKKVINSLNKCVPNNLILFHRTMEEAFVRVFFTYSDEIMMRKISSLLNISINDLFNTVAVFTFFTSLKQVELFEKNC